MGFGITVGEKGRHGGGSASIHAHPRAIAEKLPHADGYALVRGLPFARAEKQTANDLTYTRFLSEWSSGLGVTAAVLLDQSRVRPWSNYASALNVAPGEVLSSVTEGRKFPTPTFFRNIVSGSNPPVDHWRQLHLNAGLIPQCVVGECVTVRGHFSNIASNALEPSLDTHPFYLQDGSNAWPGSIGFQFVRGNSYTHSPNTFSPQVYSHSGDTPAFGENKYGDGTSASCCQPRGMEYGEIYELMLRKRRTATSQWRVDARIYSVLAGGVRGPILWAEGDWHGMVAPWDASAFLQNRVFDDLADAHASRAVGFQLGREGGDAGTSTTTHGVFEFAGIRIDQGPTASVPWPVPEYTSAERTYAYGA